MTCQTTLCQLIYFPNYISVGGASLTRLFPFSSIDVLLIATPTHTQYSRFTFPFRAALAWQVRAVSSSQVSRSVRY